ncbi:TPA: transposase [Escherichia coli]|nr:transposase [Escherichia coli]
MAGLIVHGNDIRAGCTGAGVVGPSPVWHSPSHDKGSQYVSLAYTQWLREAGLLASTGSSGAPYDNAMAESINGLYKAEVIHRKSWKNRAEVELATLTWVDWYNNAYWKGWAISLQQKQKKFIMLPSETMIWQPEFTDKTLSRKTGDQMQGYARGCLFAG